MFTRAFHAEMNNWKNDKQSQNCWYWNDIQDSFAKEIVEKMFDTDWKLVCLRTEFFSLGLCKIRCFGHLRWEKMDTVPIYFVEV